MRRWGWLLVVAGGALAIAVAATRSGLGLSTDSVAYLAEARSARERVGGPAGRHLELYADVPDDADVVTGTHFPPLFPAALALTPSVRLFNGALFVVSVVAVALLVARCSGSRVIGSVAAGLAALSPAALRAHAMVWSEPLFIALVMVGLLALATYLDGRRALLLVVGSVALGLAWLTRYAGVAFILAGLTALVIARRPVGRFLLLGGAPAAAYVGGMALAGAAASGYTLRPHRLSAGVMRQGWESLEGWFFPARSPFGIVAAGLAGAVALVLHRRVPPQRSDAPRLLAMSLVADAVVLLGSVAGFAEDVPLDERVLAPAHVVAVALGGWAVGRAMACRSAVRVPAVMVAAAVVASTAAAGVEVRRDGPRPRPDSLALSRTWPAADVPPNVRIYTTFPDALYRDTGRAGRLLPKARGNADYERDMNRLVEDV